MTTQRRGVSVGDGAAATFMTIWRKIIPFAALMACAGCAVPQYDVPYDSGLPTVQSLIKHIKCELTDLVAVPVHRGPGKFENSLEQKLLAGDYDVQVTLELEVNDTGGLTPSVTFMEPITRLISFSLGGSATLSESRDHHFTDNFQLSMRQLYADGQTVPDERILKCPMGDSDGNLARALGIKDNLERTLGIRDFVKMGFDTERLETGPSKPAQQQPAAAGKQQPVQQLSAAITTATEAFGGVITFVVTKNVSGVGPTWTTTRWKGPGGLIGLSEVNTDKLTLGFAPGPNAGVAIPRNISNRTRNGPNLGAYNFNQQQLIQSLGTQSQVPP
jgi:hypothetical protein